MSRTPSSSGGSYALTLAALAPQRVTRVVLSSAQMPYDDDASLADLQPGQLAERPDRCRP
jgi:pimeloyl-ACP methyl ester carboxylesterase